MSDLIDRAALRASLAADPAVGVYEWKRLDVVINAAPAVSCEACVHWHPLESHGDPNESCCGNEVLSGWMEDGKNPPAAFCCPCFERRNP